MALAATGVVSPEYLRRTLGPLLRSIPPPADSLTSRPPLPVGGLIGVGSVVYALILLARFTEDETYLRAAHAATLRLSEETIRADQTFRIQTGCAGALLALLALHRYCPEANSAGHTPLDLAGACMEQLLVGRIQVPYSKHRAWPLSPGKPPIIGFSYGAAGVAYALARYHAQSGDRRARDAALEGWSFVREHFDPVAGNWLDARTRFQQHYRLRRGSWRDWWASGSLDDLEPTDSPSSDIAMSSSTWCHGMSGLILSNLLLGHALPEDIDIGPALVLLEQVAAAARASATLPDLPDDLCCGLIGQVDVLITAGLHLNREDFLTAARCLAERVVRRAHETGYRLSAARGTTVFTPNLFQGSSGVSYTLLRASNPTRWPSLLMLEPPASEFEES